MDRKGRKRKERERKVREKKLRALERELEQTREQRRLERWSQQSDRLCAELECEVLLGTFGIPADTHTRSEARCFLDRLGSLGHAYDALGGYLDRLFALAHGKVPRRYPAKSSVELLASQLIWSMRCILETFEGQVAPLLGSRIGELVCGTDDLEGKLLATCEGKREAVHAWAEMQEAYFRKLDAEEELFPDEHETPADPHRSDEFAVGSLVEAVVKPLEKIRQWQLGVPTDFYRDIVQAAGELTVGATLFFLRQLYAAMTAGELHPILQREQDSLGMLHFRYVLQLEPEQHLPDPAYLEEQKVLARQLNRLDGGASLLQILECLHAAGVGHGDALAKLARLGTGQQTFSVALEMLASGGEGETFLLEVCSEHPSFLGAYETLRAARHTPAQCAAFLRDYGDYRLGDAMMADVIQRLNRRTEAVKLLVDNALCFCCGEGAQDMVALLDDLPRATRALRHYLIFARSEEPYKQLAVLRYLKHRGTDGLDTFAANLQRHRDDRIGALLKDADPEQLVSRVAAAAEPAVAPAAHPLRELPTFDLIVRYDLTPEIADLPAAALTGLDAVLASVRGSRFEPVLLGQGRLRQRLVARLRTDAAQTAVKLSNLPADGNPYLVLREILEPARAPTEPPPVAPPPPRYDRVILITADVAPQTVAHLTAVLSIPLHVISVDAASNRFNAIRPGDLVVYDTTRTGHPAYYRAKNLAARRGATFRHASRIHREAFVEVVRS